MDDREIADVLSHYPVGSVKKVMPAVGGLTNDNFFVEAEEGQFFLRRRNASYPPESIDFELELINHLVSDGFPTAPLIRTREGSFRVKLDGRYWELYRRLPGEHFRVDSLVQVRNAARLLARFHQAAADYQVRPRHILDRDVDLSKVERVINQFEAEARRRAGPLGPVLAPMLSGFFRRHGAAVVDCIQPLAGLPRVLIHGDFQPSNILFQGDQATALLDFGEAALFYRAFDVAKAVLRFATLKPGYRSQMDIETHLDLERVKAFIEAYQSELPLSEIELRTMPALLRGVYLYDMGFFMGTEKSLAGKVKQLIRSWLFLRWLRGSRGRIMRILFPGRDVQPTCSD
jgi:homoserine kinase type II